MGFKCKLLKIFTKMGKGNRRYSAVNIASHDSKLSKYKKYLSATSLDETKCEKEQKIKENFKKMVRLLMAKQCRNKQNYMISFLNIIKSCEDVCSLICVPAINMPIPSIEDMISHNLINPAEQAQVSQSQSQESVSQPFQSQILEEEPQIPIYFVCLLERVLKLISCPLTKKQHQTVVKGTWNILIKYWKDTGYTIYKVDEKVQWGLLQLLSFKFGAGKKERFQAEQKLRMTLIQIGSINQVGENEQISYFCSLQHIE